MTSPKTMLSDESQQQIERLAYPAGKRSASRVPRKLLDFEAVHAVMLQLAKAAQVLYGSKSVGTQSPQALGTVVREVMLPQFVCNHSIIVSGTNDGPLFSVDLCDKTAQVFDRQIEPFYSQPIGVMHQDGSRYEALLRKAPRSLFGDGRAFFLIHKIERHRIICKVEDRMTNLVQYYLVPPEPGRFEGICKNARSSLVFGANFETATL